MLQTRYDEYDRFYEEHPFLLITEIERTPFCRSGERNWHEETELQLCLSGCGTVLINGRKYGFTEGDIAAVNPSEIHYTDTDQRLVYACLIMNSAHLRLLGIDCRFKPLIRSPRATELMQRLLALYAEKDSPLRLARLNQCLLSLLIELAEGHAENGEGIREEGNAYETVKGAIRYIRENHQRRLTLDEIARAVYTDKFSLCRDFRRLTGQTVVEYANRHRCRMAAQLLAEGHSVTYAAEMSGFGNLSFFSRTFRRYTGMLPSEWGKGGAG